MRGAACKPIAFWYRRDATTGARITLSPTSRVRWKRCGWSRRVRRANQACRNRGHAAHNFHFLRKGELLGPAARKRMRDRHDAARTEFAPGAEIRGPQFEKPDGTVEFGSVHRRRRYFLPLVDLHE